MEIRPSADIRNRYTEISNFCKQSCSPVFLTVNGKGDTVVMSISEYNRRQSMLSVLEKLAAAKDDIISGRVYSHEQVFGEVDEILDKYKDSGNE